MDIRKFFSPTNTSKKQTFTSVTNKNSVNSNEKTSKKRRLVVIDSDSDEEPIPTRKVQKSLNSATKTTPTKKHTQANGDRKFTHTKKHPNKNGALEVTPPKNKLNLSALQKYKPEDRNLKPVSTDDFFKRPPEKKTLIKEEPKVDQVVNIADDEFNQTLKQLDEKSDQPREKVLSKSSKEKLKSPLKSEKQENKVQTPEDQPVQNKAVEGSVCKAVRSSPRKNTVVAAREIKKSKPQSEENTSNVLSVYTSIKNEKRETHSEVTGISAADIKSVNSKTDKQEGSQRHASKKADHEKESKNLSNSKDNVTPDKKKNAFNYRNYLHRDGPQSLGSKDIPEGEENCLQGITFIVTGVLESIERDEAKDLIIKYGGKVMANISKNTQYIVVGRDAGPAKLEKAEKFGTKMLNEDELYDMIRTRPGNKTTPKGIKTAKHISVKEPPVSKHTEILPKSETEDKKDSIMETFIDAPAPNKNNEERSGMMWVDKYKPSSLKQVVGQQGDRSCANKLVDWLKKWWINNGARGTKGFQKKWNAKDDGSLFKAALLSGPPGVGKTTTAQLACRELGYQYIELNASDTRSKKSLQSEISELLQNKTISSSLNGQHLVQKHVIIFDEVDGMSGNEDRGGTQELIGLIKHSKIPVICICNDRQHPKIRSLSNYCFDLRFFKPRVEQIKGAMMTLLHKEKIKIPPETLHDIIIASNQDLRQVLHHLSFLGSRDLSDARNIKTAQKDVKMGPFDVLKKVFAPEDAKASINEKASLFFHDYSLAPLFVQENYAAVMPVTTKGDAQKHLTHLSESADSISFGDVIDRTIRSQNNWSLLPTQAIYASVIPGEKMRGYLSQMIMFPKWLGKNSSRNHMDRVLQDVHIHTRLKTSGNKTELGLDYLSHFKHKLTKPLIEYASEGVPSVVEIMENYYLLREDVNSVVELTLWPGQEDPMGLIDPKAKAALTRALNKEGFRNPYSTVAVKKGKKRSADSSFDGELGEDGFEENDSEGENDDVDDLKLDAMVKQKKSKPSKNESEVSQKGKGRGKSSNPTRGRGRGRK